MVREEIKTYSVAYGEGSSQRRISLEFGDNKSAILYFMPDDSVLLPATIHYQGYHQWYFHLKEFPNIIDLLRNEKPVIFEHGSGVLNNIGTNDEPVGSGESSRLFVRK